MGSAPALWPVASCLSCTRQLIRSTDRDRICRLRGWNATQMWWRHAAADRRQPLAGAWKEALGGDASSRSCGLRRGQRCAPFVAIRLDGAIQMRYASARGCGQSGLLDRLYSRPTAPTPTPGLRGRNVLVGAVLGAGAVGIAYYYSCTHTTECTSIITAVPLMIVGAGIGALAGLLVTPVPARQ